MVRFIQIVLVLCLSAVAFAGEEFDRTMTAFTAMTLNQIKSLADLQKFELGTTNAKILKEELVKNGRAPFAPKKIEQTGATTIKLQFTSSAVVLDLKEISKGVVYVNDRQVKMDGKKTYFNYKTEVDTILAMKKKDAFLRLILSEAVAAEEDPGSYVSWGLARLERGLATIVGIETLTPEKLRNSAIFNAELEDILIASRRNSLIQQAGGSSPVITDFTCEGLRVKTVELISADTKARGGAPMVSMTEMLDGTWSLIDFTAIAPTGRDARVLANSNGDVTRNGSNVRTNIFREQPFFEFPLIAKRCCVKQGCYEKVSRAFRNINRTSPRSNPGAQ